MAKKAERKKSNETKKALDDIKAKGGKIAASCSYAAHWLEKNEWQ